ncbi:MAG: hypothetical protein K2X50_09945 [Gammaproteobacteria bacterium]|nr:hypothetical protein [Gammaproteobacteria bacterium]
MKSPLAYDRLAKENEIVVYHETVSFPVKSKNNVYIDVDRYIHNAWRAVLDVAVSYGLTGDPKYTLYVFPNVPASFKEQFYKGFNGNTDAADQAYKFFKDATSLPESTSGTRRKGSPSNSHVHVILKAILFLTKAMYQTADGVAFYPRVILDQFDNPIPVIEEQGNFYKLVQKADGTLQKHRLTDTASTMHTFDAFTNVFAQLIQRNRVQEFGSWNGLPSRLFALSEMIKVRGVQYNTSVQMATSFKQDLKLATGSADGHKEILSKMRQEETRLNQLNRELLVEKDNQAQEIQALRQKIQELQYQIKDSTSVNAQLKQQARQQNLQKESAYSDALRAKEAEYANALREKEAANQLLVDEVKRNRAQIEELKSIQALQTSPTKGGMRAASTVNNSQITEMQRANERLASHLAAQTDVMGEQTKTIDGLTRQVERLGVDNERLASVNEKLEAENGVLLRAFQNFFEFIMSWFQAAPESLKDCLNVEGVPNAEQGTTFAQVLVPKITQVTSLLRVHGVTTSFGIVPNAAVTDEADESQAGSKLFAGLDLRTK